LRTCLSAAELHSGLAIMLGHPPVEKSLRDCLSFLHSDGAQESCARASPAQSAARPAIAA